MIAGNYEFGWDGQEDLSIRRPRYAEVEGTPRGGKHLKGVRYLEDDEITVSQGGEGCHQGAYQIDGVKFYGSPWHPSPGYPFYADRNGGLARKWERIPNDTDILITHTPPLGRVTTFIETYKGSGYLDLYADEEHWGCRDLLERVEQVAPRSVDLPNPR